MPGIIREDDINSNVRDAEYAVRGAITNRAAEIEKDLASGKSQYPFDKVLYCNLGNPQALNQKPISYPRQLLACCEYPELVEASGMFPKDVIEKAKTLSGSLKPGAYSTSVGHQATRDAVAEGITKRDGHKADPDLVFITNGASGSVKFVLEMLITGPKDAFLVPVPQYPLYSAELTLQGGVMLPYYLDESANWSVNIDEVKRALNKAKKDGLNVKGMVVINPGNPTGQVLDSDNQLELLRVCQEHGIAIMADEVYQENVWAEGKEFTSFRKVAIDNKIDDVVVVSMHSISKGFMGECGHRGGYMDIINAPEDFITQLKKLMSINLCANTVGQILVAAMMSPPKEGEESYEQYCNEKAAILASLKRRAKKLCDKLNKLDGITCCDSQGALYVFPRLHLPQNAHKAAKESGRDPDFFYCKELLENTGIVTVPGSGFKQAPETYHVRITILAPEEHMDDLVDKLSSFHNSFMDKYKD